MFQDMAKAVTNMCSRQQLLALQSSRHNWTSIRLLPVAALASFSGMDFSLLDLSPQALTQVLRATVKEVQPPSQTQIWYLAAYFLNSFLRFLERMRTRGWISRLAEKFFRSSQIK
jgi:hypothetical protein